MKKNEWIQLGILIILAVTALIVLLLGLWNKGISGSIITLYVLVFILFILIGFLFYKVYNK